MIDCTRIQILCAMGHKVFGSVFRILQVEPSYNKASITKLNSVLWDRDVTPKTKTHISNAIVKSTITYVAESWCLKAKTVTKLNSTEMDFWRRSARISMKGKIRNIIINT